MNAAPSSSALANDSHAAVIGSTALFGLRPYHEEAAVTIYHGDCRQIVPLLGRFDLLLTDPPYGIGASSGVGKYGVMKWGGSKDKKWDESTPPTWLLEMLLDCAARHVVWGMNYYTLPPSRNFMVWDKGAGFRGRTFAECELAWCSWDANAKVYARDPLAAGDYKGKEHPTQKPLALMQWCIQQAGDVQTILDPFAGSGTTGEAAKIMGKKAVLIEREERYCEIAARRLAQDVLPLDCPTLRYPTRRAKKDDEY